MIKSLFLWRIALFVLLIPGLNAFDVACAIQKPASPEQAPRQSDSGTLITFDSPFLFTYSTWEKKARIENGHIILRGEGLTSKGGGGANFTLDLSQSATNTPAIRVKVGHQNTLKTIKLMLVDTENRQGIWDFPLPAAEGDFTLVTAREGAAFNDPNLVEKSGKPNLKKIMQWHIMGDWGGDGPIDVEIAAVLSVAPDATVLTQRKEKAKREAETRESQRKELDELKKKYATVSELSPAVVRISALAPDVIAVEIAAGKIRPASLVRYTRQNGDTTDIRKNNQGAVTDVILKRNGNEVGWLLGPNRDWLRNKEVFTGDPLLTFVAEDSTSYQISSTDDSAYATGTKPLFLGRKSKPTNWCLETPEMEMMHTIYLRLPRPMQSGKRYSVQLGEINVRNKSIALIYNPRNVRSEAVHVNQIGYRPDDPAKRAFVSCWMGSGNGLKLPASLKFSLLEDKTGKVVYEGSSERLWPADKPELMQTERNFNGTDVLRFDFSAFKTPGRYRISVEGTGCSYPFDIAPDVWTRAFKVQMRGLYHQRSGIKLEPPYSDFVRPRDMYPGDATLNGTKVVWTKYRSVEAGNEPGDAMVKAATDQPANGWGGYHDAGDWNPRRVTHMRATMAQLEVFDLFPQTFSAMKLNIPARPGVPDILTEAIFEFECFRRLQQKDGGVGMGLETNGDPYGGEVSWLQSMTIYAFSPDYANSWYYAMVGARLSYLLQKYDPKLAATYRESAIAAFNWAESDFARDKSAGLTEKRGNTWEAIDFRNFAALELYRLTRDRKWHEKFVENTVLRSEKPDLFQYGKAVQRDQAFAYARLPEGLGEPALKRNAVAGIVLLADRALEYANNNAFGLTTPDKGKPMFLGFYTTPDATDLVHAHYLTGDAKYLQGAVQSTQFQSGSNPNNIVYTTGLGANPIKNPFKLDSRRTGQPAPAGLTPYGNVDFSKWGLQWITWPITYYLSKNTTPDPYSWPTAEAYWDLGGWPALNEFTVDIWAPNIAVWGYLAARK